MKITNEILNRYIDRELTGTELQDFLKELNGSAEIKQQLQTLETASNSFKNIKEYSTSDDFTSKLMIELNRKFKSRKSDKVFILSISSIFVVISLAITGFILSRIIGTENPDSSLAIGDQILEILGKVTQSLTAIFPSNSISLMGAIISFGVIISGYFYFDFLKNTRQN